MPTLDPGGVVLFDAVGTLLRPEPSVAEAYAAAGRRFGSRLTRAEIDLRFRTVFADDKQADLRDREGRTDGTREIQRWHSIVKSVFDDVSPIRVDALFDELWAHFATPESWRVFDDVRPALERLRNSGQVLAVASNFDERLLEITLSLLPEITYEHVLVSSLVGYRKPASGFFRACEKRLADFDITPDAKSFTLIGDDVNEDFLGARAAGWNAILLDRNDMNPDVSPRVRSLEELV